MKKEKLKFIVNGEKFEWQEQYIAGAEIKKLGNIPKDEELYLVIKEPWEHELISDDTKVNLARPKIEHFFSKETTISLIINGKPKNWDKGTRISFKEVVELAFGVIDESPRASYTVTYDRGPRENREGSMVKGDIVFVKHKMIFNVSATNQS